VVGRAGADDAAAHHDHVGGRGQRGRGPVRQAQSTPSQRRHRASASDCTSRSKATADQQALYRVFAAAAAAVTALSQRAISKPKQNVDGVRKCYCLQTLL